MRTYTYAEVAARLAQAFPERPAPAVNTLRNAVARGATLRRTLIAVPARTAMPQHRPMLHLPAHWPWAPAWLTLWDRVLGQALPPPVAA